MTCSTGGAWRGDLLHRGTALQDARFWNRPQGVVLEDSRWSLLVCVCVCARVFAYGMDVVVYVLFDSQQQVWILIICTLDLDMELFD